MTEQELLRKIAELFSQYDVEHNGLGVVGEIVYFPDINYDSGRDFYEWQENKFVKRYGKVGVSIQ